MSATSNQKGSSSSQTAATPKHGEPLHLVVVTGDHVPSFKNTKRSILDRNTGLQRTLTPKKIKGRMNLLERRIESALYSLFPTGDAGTVSECRKRLRTVLSGFCDDSLKVVPEFSFGVRYVEKGQEGVEIEITPVMP